MEASHNQVCKHEAQNELLNLKLEQKEKKLDNIMKENGKLEEQLKQKDDEIAKKDKELQELFIILSIRKCLESYEYLITPELVDAKSVYKHPALSRLRSTNQQFDYHEGKWLIILSKTTDTRVIQLKKLLQAKNIPEDQFCRTMAGFFTYSSAAIHVPPIKKYSEATVKRALIDKFGIQDDITIRSITKVLMKVL